MTALSGSLPAFREPVNAVTQPPTARSDPTTVVERPLSATLRFGRLLVPQRVSVSCTAIGFTCVASPFFFTAAASASGVPVRTGKVP